MTPISFEVFPPRSVLAAFNLKDAVEGLAAFGPQYVSVTYGAGGSTREATRETLRALSRGQGLRVAAHLTCVGATREETLALARGFREEGARDVVALRGDPPEGRFAPHPGGFADAAELVSALAEAGGWRIHVGAYPDPHPEARGPGADAAWLARKFEAGADAAITQFFFEAESYFRLRDECAALGVEAPIVPGVLPVGRWASVVRFARGCGARVPGWVEEAFERAGPEGEAALGADLAAELCRRLVEGGAPGLHFYALNKAEPTATVCRRLGLGGVDARDAA
jgi:methylenetetrahydrofolate reductase (NADPH)